MCSLIVCMYKYHMFLVYMTHICWRKSCVVCFDITRNVCIWETYLVLDTLDASSAWRVILRHLHTKVFLILDTEYMNTLNTEVILIRVILRHLRTKVFLILNTEYIDILDTEVILVRVILRHLHTKVVSTLMPQISPNMMLAWSRHTKCLPNLATQNACLISPHKMLA